MPKKRALVEEEDEGNTSPVEEVVVKAVFDEEGHRARDILEPAPLLADGAASLKIVSWNVNGLRSLATTNKSTLLNVIKEQKPDILCLQVELGSLRQYFTAVLTLPKIFHFLNSYQETKIQDNTIGDYDNFLDGYESYWNCSTDKKGYSGTVSSWHVVTSTRFKL